MRVRGGLQTYRVEDAEHSHGGLWVTGQKTRAVEQRGGEGAMGSAADTSCTAVTYSRPRQVQG